MDNQDGNVALSEYDCYNDGQFLVFCRTEAKKRRAELQKLREEKERQDEMLRIERELACMAEEDVLGEQMRDDLHALERWEAEAERALKMVGELGEFHNEDAQGLLREEEAGS